MATVIQLKGLNGVLETLKSLPPEVVSKAGGPVKAALRTGARVILKEAALNLARSTESLGEDQESTGLLLRSLIASRGKQPTGGKGERYLVRVKSKRYPRKGRAPTTLATAHYLEYGTEKQPAEPWLRPAFNTKAEEAIRTIESDLVKRLDRIVRNLAQKNKGK